MIKLYLLFIALSGVTTLSAQFPCLFAGTNRVLQTDHQEVNINSRGVLFWDGLRGAKQHQIPYNYGQAGSGTIFAGNTWISARTVNGDLMIMHPTYEAGSGYGHGPLDALTGDPVTTDCADFNQVWSVARWSVERLRADFNDNGNIDNAIPIELLQWPAKGNPHFFSQMGYALPNQDMAPFYDNNSDGLYDPMDGDYPVYKNGVATAIAEQVLWTTFHSRFTTSGSNSLAMKFEIQQTAYALDCGQKDWLNQSLFIKHKIINRSTNTRYEVRYGNWNDFDLGCSLDDYLGTDTTRNTVYAYNADNNDEVNCSSGYGTGYGINPPVQAVTFLSERMTSAIFDLGRVGSDPVSSLRYERLLSGLFPNGTPITTGGDGYDPASTAPPVSYVFPSNPNDTTGWSMASANLSGLDPRMLGATYKDSLLAGETWEIDLVYSYHRNFNNSAFQNVNLMEQQVDSLQQYYNNGLEHIACAPAAVCAVNCVFPGDANNNGIANDFDILEMGWQYGQTIAPRANAGNRWFPYAPPTPIFGAYADADGLGEVDSLDLFINTRNWDLTHSLYTGIPEGSNAVGTDLYFEREIDSFFYPHVLVPLNGSIRINPHFADTTTPIQAHGLTYRVRYDETVLLHVPRSYPATVGNGGWLKADGATVFHREIFEEGVLHYVTSRLDNGNYTGGGELGAIAFKVKADALINADTMYTQVCFEDFQVVTATGRQVNIGANCITIAYSSTFNSVQVIPTAPTIRLYPNPAQEALQVDLGTAFAKQIEVLDLLGQQMQQYQEVEGQLTIPRGQLPTGMYVVRVSFENGSQSTHKIVFK